MEIKIVASLHYIVVIESTDGNFPLRKIAPPKGNPRQPPQRWRPKIIQPSNLLQLDRFEEDLNSSKVRPVTSWSLSSSHDCTPEFILGG
jgi:hypothetical protein